VWRAAQAQEAEVLRVLGALAVDAQAVAVAQRRRTPIEDAIACVTSRAFAQKVLHFSLQ
jgi:hypothetical protein